MQSLVIWTEAPSLTENKYIWDKLSKWMSHSKKILKLPLVMILFFCLELTRWAVLMFSCFLLYFLHRETKQFKKSVVISDHYWQRFNVPLMNPNEKVCVLCDHQTNSGLTERAQEFAILHHSKKHIRILCAQILWDHFILEEKIKCFFFSWKFNNKGQISTVICNFY